MKYSSLLFVMAFSACFAAGTFGQDSPVVKLNEKQGVIDVTVAGKLFTTYHYADDFIYPCVRPFFWPVKAADGTDVTIDQAQDKTLHPYQRSVWVGNGDVNGADHWKFSGKPNPPKQRHLKFDKIDSDGFVQELAWEDKDGQPMLRETRTVHFIVYPDGSRGIDITLAMTPVKEDVTFGDSKDHGLFSVRPIPSISHEPKLLNSNGDTDNKCSAKPADWCDESGQINGKTYGIAILAHPNNFVHPEFWHAHADARLAPDPLGLHESDKTKFPKGAGNFTIRMNTTATFRYCAIFHVGEMASADLAKLYSAFAATAVVNTPSTQPIANTAIAASDPQQPTSAPTTQHAPGSITIDGTGDFKTIQSAIDSIPLNNDHPRTISLQPGRYYEKLMVKPPFIHLVGKDPENTILTFDDYALRIGDNGKIIGTNASHTLFVKGHDFEADNLTIENTKGPRRVVKQTMAVGVQADRVIFRNCRLLSHQDTLLAGSGRQYFVDCTIEGDADFIFGDAAAVFDHCEIRSNDSGVVTAQERTAADSTTGFVFSNCRFTATPTVRKERVYLGRPFRPYARVILLNCELGAHISPAGWVPVQGGDYTKTADFAEYRSSGVEADTAHRVAWSHQLSDDQAQPFATEKFLSGGDQWRPANGVSPTTQAAN